MISPRLIRIDRFLNYVSNRVDYSHIDPKNTKTVERNFKKKKHNPIFKYRKVDRNLRVLRDILPEIYLNSSPIQKALDEKRQELSLKIQLLGAIGTESFSDVSCKIYPPPSKDLLDKAKKIVHQLKPSKRPSKIPKQEAVRMLRTAFKLMDIKWKIKNENIVSNARIRSSKHILELKKREKFSKNFVRRLIIHEIGTHVLRTENGKFQPLKIFKNGFAGNLETEEGIAAYNEYKAGLMTHSILRKYAGRVLAVHYALNGSFIKTYKKLHKYFNHKTAWKLTIRAKRGLSNTKKHGAYTKDVVYLRGFLKVLEYAENHDINRLYIGKIGIKDLTLIKNIPNISLPRYSPQILFDHHELVRSTRAIHEHELQKVLS